MSYHLIRFFFFRRKVQEALEKENKENFKKRDEEKRKVDEATEKAKELMRVRKEGRVVMILRYILRYLSPQAAAQSASAVRRSVEIDWPCLIAKRQFNETQFCHFL